jgi:hypothetical protein
MQLTCAIILLVVALCSAGGKGGYDGYGAGGGSVGRGGIGIRRGGGGLGRKRMIAQVSCMLYM